MLYFPFHGTLSVRAFFIAACRHYRNRRCQKELLKAAASWEEIRKLCDEAMEYRTASVCVPSCYVKKIRENYPRLTICTVVGFPLGNGNSESKAAETIHALDDGADEIDMVINIGAVKNKDYDLVTEEIAVLKEIAEDKILKEIGRAHV